MPSPPSVRAVDVLAQLKTARFDRPLTYRVPDNVTVGLGDVVRVPLGTREVFAYVLTGERDVDDPDGRLRFIERRADVPRAFDAMGLALAEWMSETYLCSLSEALGAVVLASAIPRAVDRLVPLGEKPDAARFAAVPQRLVDLLWGDLMEGFPLETLLRHPEARRSGDRRALLAAIGVLVRAGVVERRRSFGAARMHAATRRVLVLGEATVRGAKAAALAARVRDERMWRRSDAVLAGFSDAVIRRAIAVGAIREEQQAIEHGRAIRSVLPSFDPTPEQRAAIDTIDAMLATNIFDQLLLHGITGSGKTLVYLHAIAHTIAAGGRAIMLVPEISLTPQTAGRFEAAFGDRVAVLHSALSDRERFDAWQAAARGDVSVVVGARSAVFAPLADVRLIVIDESHETSYRQDTAPRYDAIDVARERMRRAGGVVVLGSATPALDDYARALGGRFPMLRLTVRATAQPLPVTHVVNMATEFDAGNKRMFSTLLIEAIGAWLERNEKTVLFVNRRGSASFLLCRACGFVPECDRCATSLTVHRSEHLLRCHYCDAQKSIPVVCPQCGEGPIREFGVGTERVADEVQKLFPAARVVRMDSDTTTRIGDHARLLDRFVSEGDVLVGTQMVAKGLDFPQVTLVGAIAADLDMHVADYSAAERTFDLITQVSGRSGRASAGEAIIQTYAPDAPAIAFAAKHDFAGFAEHELRERKALRWPPYVRLVLLGAIGRVKGDVETAIATYADLLRDDRRWDVLGPVTYPVARVNDEWRYRIAIKTRDLDALRSTLRSTIVPAARRAKTTRLVITIDR